MSLGRIVVVDDQPKIRRFMRATLVAEGYEVDEAKTARKRSKAFVNCVQIWLYST